MRLYLILIFLVCFGYIINYVINLLIKERLTETFISDENGNPVYFLDEIKKPINEIALTLGDRDDHYFLMTAIMPGKKAITELKETNPNETNFYYIDEDALSLEKPNPLTVKSRTSKLSYPRIKDKLTCVKDDDPIRAVISHYQPYIYDKAEVINYYDQPLYRDWRYPLRPIDIRFAANPEKYCEMFPNVYPCYVYYSKW